MFPGPNPTLPDANLRRIPRHTDDALDWRRGTDLTLEKADAASESPGLSLATESLSFKFVLGPARSFKCDRLGAVDRRGRPPQWARGRGSRGAAQVTGYYGNLKPYAIRSLISIGHQGLLAQM